MKSIKLVENNSSNFNKKAKISLDKKCNINICSPSSLNSNKYYNEERDSSKKVKNAIKLDTIPFPISDKAINNGDKKKLNIIMTPCDIANRKLHGNDENIFYEDYNKSDYEIYDSENETISDKNEFIVADLNNNYKQISPNTGDINSDMSENNISITSYNNDNNEKQQLDTKYCNKDEIKPEVNLSFTNELNPSDEDSQIINVNKCKNDIQEKLKFNNPNEEIEDKNYICHTIENKLEENNKENDTMSNNSKESELNKITKTINREEIEITLKNLDNLPSLTILTPNELNIVFKTIFDIYDDKNQLKELNLSDFNAYDHLTQEDEFFIYLFYKVSNCNSSKTQPKSKTTKNEILINFTKIDKHLKNNHSKEKHILEQYKQNELNLITINYIKNMCIIKVDEIKKVLHSVNCSLNSEIKNGNMYDKEFLNCFELIPSQGKKIKKSRLNGANRFSNYENFWVFIKKDG